MAVESVVESLRQFLTGKKWSQWSWTWSANDWMSKSNERTVTFEVQSTSEQRNARWRRKSAEKPFFDGWCIDRQSFLFVSSATNSLQHSLRTLATDVCVWLRVCFDGRHRHSKRSTYRWPAASIASAHFIIMLAIDFCSSLFCAIINNAFNVTFLERSKQSLADIRYPWISNLYFMNLWRFSTLIKQWSCPIVCFVWLRILRVPIQRQRVKSNRILSLRVNCTF